ncbi:SUN domain containing protein 3 [Dissostichus eleginoides]|uniref:SUN domain containing protein 3 n=1 Tax=Dissostichus eleginoides TaxID=100907 RepID=A0AAD9FEL0_DISEL|nr:SUN domain containing protein 3 [Dissostichus eleginoides]
MLRRSTRLDSQGYYDTEGLPIICYKEHLNRIFHLLFFILVLCFGFACREEFLLKKLNKETVTNFEGQVNTCREEILRINKDTMPNFALESQVNTLSEEILRLNKVLNSLQLVVDTMPNFALESQVNTLSEEILRLNKVLNSLQLVVDTMPNFALESQVNTLSEEILRLNKVLNSLQPVADTMPNFALESQEARVLLDRSSQPYSKRGGCAYLFGIFCKRPVHPRTVLQGGSPPVVGRCWPFEGGRGHLFIALSHPVYISHVTLGHVSKNLSPTGTIPSSPKTFSVYGMNTLDDKGTYLGTFLYDQDGDATQTFELPDHGKGVFKYVKLQVESNWGHPDYTCLYNFRVHGKLAEVAVF